MTALCSPVERRCPGYVEPLQPHATLAEHYLEAGSYFAERGAGRDLRRGAPLRNLTPDELSMLLPAITEPKVPDAPLLAHKLGGGQALGLGSVAVVEGTLRYFDPGTYYGRWGRAPLRTPGADGCPPVRELEATARRQLNSWCRDSDEGCGHRRSSDEDRERMSRVAKPSDAHRVRVAMAYRNALPRDSTAVMPPDAHGWTSVERLPALLDRHR